MAWIEVHQSLPTHRKTRRLARELKLNGKDFPKAVGYMVMLWLWAIDNAPNGDLGGIDPYDVADAAEWSGDPEKFMDALKKSGFVDDDMHIHDWDVYIGKLIDRREANAQRNREARAKKRAERSAGVSRSAAHDSNERITSVSRDIATVPNPTVPNPTVPNLSPQTPHGGAGEEERRNPSVEEVKEYARLAGLEVDADVFVAINSARGWRDSMDKPIRDWRMWLENSPLARKEETHAAATEPDRTGQRDEYGGEYL